MKKLLLRLTVLLALFSLLTGYASAADHVRALSTRSNGCPYYIMVNRRQNTVTVYGLDDAGYYTVPVKAMICSTGRQGHATPLGNFSIYDERDKWHYMVDDTYGQYACRFNGSILFHSICYRDADPSTMLTYEYNALGEKASLGCVRLQVADAKRIYDNCVNGTLVTVYDGDDPGPLGKPEKAVAEISGDMPGGWDPTDPRENNPWNKLRLSSFSVKERYLSLEAGEVCALTVQRSPADSVYPKAVWTSDNPLVATVDDNGTVTARGDGEAIITVTCSGFTDLCSVEVHGNLLPFNDVPTGAWYYADVRYAYENGLLSGTAANTFSPQAELTRVQLIQVLHNMAGSPEPANKPVTIGVRSWYYDALRWAKQQGLTVGIRTSEPDLYDPITRAELVTMLYRFEARVGSGKGDTSADLSAFTDLEGVDENFLTGLRWAVGNGILTGGSGRLQPDGTVSRAQAAAILHRYHELSGI